MGSIIGGFIGIGIVSWVFKKLVKNANPWLWAFMGWIVACGISAITTSTSERFDEWPLNFLLPYSIGAIIWGIIWKNKAK